MSDYLIKALAFDDKVRVYTINSTELVKNLQTNHDTWPVASAALGRATTIGVLMGSMLKGEEKLTIQINGDGPIGQIVIDAKANGEVRGYVTNPHIDLPLSKAGKLDVAKAVGKGNIYVIKDMGLKEPYRGSTPIISGELAEDFTYYFVHSEQTPSSVGAGVLVNPDHSIRASGGFIIQLLPGLNEEDLDKIELAINSMPPISSLIDQGVSPEGILEIFFKNQYRILERTNVSFKCNCSRDRIENILINLGTEEIEDMINKQGRAEVTCQFCRTTYQFNIDELNRMKVKIDKK